ncbi:MAG: M50 family metallopeptidase [Planctomycetota bacterium]
MKARPDRGGPTTRNELLILGALVGMVWLSWDTVLMQPLKMLVVMLHEISHGLAAILTGGSIARIELNPRFGGACYTYGGSRFITLSAGYLGSMLFGAAFLLTAARTRADKGVCMGVGCVLAAITVLYIGPTQNLFGFLFGLGSGAALFLVGWKAPPRVADLLLKVIGLTSCLYATLDIKSDVLDRRGIGSDADMLQDLTHIPSVVWGVIWILVSLIVTAGAFAIASRGEAKRTGSA